MLQTINVTLDSLVDAHNTTSKGRPHFLHIPTGEIIWTMDYNWLGNVSEEDAPSDYDLDDLLDDEDYLEIPLATSNRSDMKAFIDTLDDDSLQVKLRDMLQSPLTILDWMNVWKTLDNLQPGLLQHWHDYRRNRQIERINTWLQENDLILAE